MKFRTICHYLLNILINWLIVYLGLVKMQIKISICFGNKSQFLLYIFVSELSQILNHFIICYENSSVRF